MQSRHFISMIQNTVFFTLQQYDLPFRRFLFIKRDDYQTFLAKKNILVGTIIIINKFGAVLNFFILLYA